MALKATVFKAELQVADMNRNYYQTHALTIARHPSENDERMMVRLLLFGLHAHEELVFTRGLCVADEPDIWRKNLNGDVIVWIEAGQPDEKRIKKACSRAQQVFIYTYQHRSAMIWWQQIRPSLDRFENLTVVFLQDGASSELAALARRTMKLQCTIQDESCWMGDGETSVQVDLDYGKR